MKVGLAVGLGTGPELAEIFEKTLECLARHHRVEVELVRSEHRYQTYVGLLADRVSAAEVARLADADALHYERFLLDLRAAGGEVLFRTAINAQPLYRVREKLLGVKLERFATFHGELLLVRDGAQGFYAGVNDEPGSAGVIERRCEFRRDTTRRILDHAISEAAAVWGGVDRIDRIQLVYKFHLLDMRLAEWVRDYAEERGLEIFICQPDTANRQLAREEWRGRVLVIGANEWSDIMHAELVQKYGHGAQEERFSRNVYLHPDLDGLTEYQTVHGSADDIAGRDLVNPLATLRAAADVLERFGGCRGAAERLEAVLRGARGRGLITADSGGEASTSALVRHVLEHYSSPAGDAPATEPGARRRDALLVVDLQNDYCAQGGCFDALGLIDPQQTRRLADVAQRLIARARASGTEVIFVRTVMDAAVPEIVARRNQEMGRDGCVRSGSWGAETFGPVPRPGDPVVVKRGYDAFLGTTLERELRRRGVERLVLTGVFSDVCVDALARSAYQLGFELVVVEDGTLPLEREQSACLSFMQRFYAARVLNAEAVGELLAKASPVRSNAGSRAKASARLEAPATAR